MIPKFTAMLEPRQPMTIQPPKSLAVSTFSVKLVNNWYPRIATVRIYSLTSSRLLSEGSKKGRVVNSKIEWTKDNKYSN